MTDHATTLAGTFPYTPHFTDSPGFRMHYVDEGPADGEVLLCLHGEPTWGYLFRDLIKTLRGTWRVVVPDHMGFGKSETPQGRSYWLQDHIDNLERLVLSLDLTGITLVMHDFGGPVGMGLAARHPDRIRRVISANGPTPFGQATLPQRVMANAAESPWFRWIAKAEADGSLETVLGQLGFNILSTLKLNGFEHNAIISDAWLAAYAAPFATPADCLGAIGWAKGFATGAHRFETPDAAAERAIRGKPALAIWGEADRTLGAEHFLPLFTEIFPAAPVKRLAGVGHYCLEDAPAAVAGLVSAFMRQT
ncbi:alpha/beta hydrolase [Cupriavidus sp. USMAA2-4]|uniref:Alpha/beta hydrolase n=1 Tax=Cupriavidus malaysiensis TaxID=367825 RepID=A0ABM6FD14_9BURK|nr:MULTISPECIES: alpha/beta fold hydrolase [Cupriavidus]AOY96625.1 alpha/beta hydrolase [Cupriavidus sp. USMAA2-4]AOZ02969.1 alpha/beta hydrolase [Cupriavidus sp. USMAHM13]AOZ09659.1 alpha/beta hydrolase [Cupriavidus malaysiensis]